MLRYEKPVLVEMSQLAEAEGGGIDSPDCADGYVVTDTCPGGSVVTGGCNEGGIENVVCGGGGNIQT